VFSANPTVLGEGGGVGPGGGEPPGVRPARPTYGAPGPDSGPDSGVMGAGTLGPDYTATYPDQHVDVRVQGFDILLVTYPLHGNLYRGVSTVTPYWDYLYRVWAAQIRLIERKLDRLAVITLSLLAIDTQELAGKEGLDLEIEKLTLRNEAETLRMELEAGILIANAVAERLRRASPYGGATEGR
jgi:hypothetical protein